MRIPLVLRRALFLLAGLAGGSVRAEDSCQITAAYAGMETHEIVLQLPGGGEKRLAARVADDNAERAAGFQHICARDFARHPILFQFEGRVHTAFHMHNVHGPLDIAFLDGDGRVLEIQRMNPYVPGTAPVYYRPSRPFAAALETAAGRLTALNPTRVELSGK